MLHCSFEIQLIERNRIWLALPFALTSLSRLRRLWTDNSFKIETLHTLAFLDNTNSPHLEARLQIISATQRYSAVSYLILLTRSANMIRQLRLLIQSHWCYLVALKSSLSKRTRSDWHFYYSYYSFYLRRFPLTVLVTNSNLANTRSSRFALSHCHDSST